MRTDTSFHRAVADAGGPLDPSNEPPPFRELGSHAITVAEQLRDGVNERSDILWPIGDVEIALVNNATFNAFAHYDDGKEGIALFGGLFYLLLDLSGTLWSHPEFLRRTHPCTQTKFDLESISQRVAELRTTRMWTHPIGVYPLSEERAFRTFNTALTAYVFIIFHEFGHLVRAHVPYLQESAHLKVDRLIEHNHTLRLVDNEVLRTLEIDADIYAARAVADCALTTWRMGKLFPIDFPLERRELRQYIIDIAIGLSLSFFCMDLGAPNRVLNSDSTHPSPGYRLYLSYLAMMNLLRKPFGIPVGESLQLCLDGFFEVHDFWSVLKLPMNTVDYDPLEMAKIAVESYESYLEIGSKLSSAMDSRLRRLGTSLDHYEQFRSFYD